MFVGDYDGVNVRWRATQSFESAKNFPPTDSGIEKKTGLLGLNQRCIARAARSQNRDAESDAKPLAILPPNFRPKSAAGR
jgi:hypothetical protein